MAIIEISTSKGCIIEPREGYGAVITGYSLSAQEEGQAEIVVGSETRARVRFGESLSAEYKKHRLALNGAALVVLRPLSGCGAITGSIFYSERRS